MSNPGTSRGPILALAAVLLLTAGLSLISIHVPFGRDQGVAALVATTILDGGAPYRDVYHFNFPGIFFSYALAMKFFGRSVEAVNLFDLFYRLATLVAISGVGRAVSGNRAGLFAGLFYGLFSTVLYTDYWDIAQKETFTVLPVSLAVLFGFQATRPERLGLGRLFLAGVLVALACHFKPTIGVVGLALAAEVAWPGKRRGAESLRGLVVLAAGFFLGWVPLLVYLLASGTLRDMIEGVFTYGRFYGGQAYAGLGKALGLALIRTAKWALDWRVLLALSIVSVIRAGRGKLPGLRLLLFWTLAAYLNGMVQMKFFTYHWIPLLGPLSVLAGMGIPALFPERPRRRGPLLPLAAALFLALLLLGSLFDPARRYRRELLYDLGLIQAEGFYRAYGNWGEGDICIRAELKVADYLRRNTAPDEKVLVFGLEPGINFLAGRNSPTRFVYDLPLTTDTRGNAGFAAYQEKIRGEFLADLGKHPPEYVVVVEKDATSIEPKESYQQMQAFIPFRDWLLQGYFLETKIEHYFLFRRKPGA